MKKPLIILTLFSAFFASLFSFASPVSAKIFTPDGDIALTIDEIEILGQKIEQKLDELCEDDPDCRMNVYFSNMEENEDYFAVDAYYNNLLILSLINPSNNEVRVRYHSKDGMNRWFDKYSPIDSIRSLKMAWGEEDIPFDKLYIYRNGGLFAEDESLLPENLYMFYSETGENFIVADIEWVTFARSEANFSSINNGIIQYEFMTEYSNASGTVSFSDCLNSSYYEPGMECRAVFTTSSNLVYVPYLNGVPAYPNYLFSESDVTLDNDKQNTTKEPETITTEKIVTVDNLVETIKYIPYPVYSTITKAVANNDATTNISPEDNEENTVSTTMLDNFVAPLSGEQEKCSGSADNFPWWFLILVLCCDIVVMILFWPKNIKKTKK